MQLLAALAPASASDWSNMVLATVAVLGQMSTIAVLLLRDASRRATISAIESAEMKALADANTRIAGALEKLEQWTREHEIADERRWAKVEERDAQQAKINERLANIAEDLARRITNVAIGAAPGPALEVAPNAAGRRR